MLRHASCACGALSVACEGDPVRVSVCHCLACQRRTGSAFGVQARYPRDCVTLAEGGTFTRVAESGNPVTFHFCPACGSTVWWELGALPGFVGVAVGAFADPGFPAPTVTVYEARRHGWCEVSGVAERWD